MLASRSGVRGAASASAAGAGQESADTTGARSLSRWRTSGVTTPTATAPHASVRRARVLRKVSPAYPAIRRSPPRKTTKSAEDPDQMALARRLLTLLAFLSIATTAAAAPADDQAATARSGGALALPLQQVEGGGAVAPPASGDAAATESDSETPEAQPDQEPTPTTPQGEEQPGQQPTPQQDQQAPGEGTGAPTTEAPATPGEVAGGEGGGGFLPSTGLELAALVAIGLGLLLAGIALRSRGRVRVTARRY